MNTATSIALALSLADWVLTQVEQAQAKSELTDQEAAAIMARHDAIMARIRAKAALAPPTDKGNP